MKPYFSSLILLCFVLISHNALAGANSGTPSFVTSKKFYQALKKMDVDPQFRFQSKLCTCQLLHVKSKNEDVQNLALFSEKTSNGDISIELNVAKTVLEKEKKKMKGLFYSKISVMKELNVQTDCASLYQQLKFNNDGIRMYDIINADVRAAVLK